MEELFENVFGRNDEIFTRNLVPGREVYGEDLVEEDGTEFREWSFRRSKAAAAIKKGLREFPLESDSEVLYLGASTGTTVSHLSDIVTDGIVYAVEYSPEVARQLLSNVEDRDNVAPLLGNARNPGEYAPFCSKVDIIYQDVAQRDQVEILERNARKFLKEGGTAMIALKARSISSGSPGEVFQNSRERLEKNFDVLGAIRLEPFHRDHLFLVLQDVES